MKFIKYQALMHGEQFVNANMLDDGIYGTPRPNLFREEETIQSLTETAKGLKDATGECFLPDIYFENLAKCTLKPYFLVDEATFANAAQSML